MPNFLSDIKFKLFLDKNIHFRIISVQSFGLKDFSANASYNNFYIFMLFLLKNLHPKNNVNYMQFFLNFFKILLNIIRIKIFLIK